ncbi:hypothetical protein OH76DRAFT_872066 [Lentinus brumalis]|uniref:DUF6533 domain-containing protein n=1 Tax=Lentinus brumalis TaxID=2498619 RepID=A0A371DRI9_9APHY|nr:hypothetical protein OH76DRAFT_872066 [Polyporus brumalis]
MNRAGQIVVRPPPPLPATTMSESSTSDNVEIIAQYESLFVSLCCSYATFVYMCYDWMLTLDDEISLFWNRRVSAASILYFAIRYPVVIFWIMGYPTTHLQGVRYVRRNRLPGVLPGTEHIQLRGVHVHRDGDTTSDIPLPGYILCLARVRIDGTKQVSCCHRPLLRFGANICQLREYGGSMLAGHQRDLTRRPLIQLIFRRTLSGRSPYMYRTSAAWSATMLTTRWVLFTGISRGMLSVADLLVIIITWQKTSYTVQNLQGSVGPSLAKTLLRSGIIYFIPLAFLNILHTILTETGAEQFLRNSSVVSLFIDPATSVLACRFLINLRRVEFGHNDTSTGPSTFSTTMRFTPDVSNPTESTASGPGSQGTKTLPPFISSMGELVDMGFSASTLHETGRWDTYCEDTSATELATVVDQVGVPAAERPASPRGREDMERGHSTSLHVNAT